MTGPSAPLPPFRPATKLVRAGTLGAAIVLAWLASCAGIAAWVDRALEPVRFAALGHRASGNVVVVEMDAASAAAIDRWPWPRANYALVLDRLRRAGAASVVFDVDFSAYSTVPDDAAFAVALARADGLVALPTFAQQARAADRRSLDAMPITLLRQHVALASVSVSPDEDGLVRDAPLGTMTYGQPHPSLSAYIAHRSGAADQPFPIDFAIDPATIPRLSFVAVRDGHVDPATVRGRDVLIGATAIEMGDRYAVPRWGNLPGVVLQALAAETLQKRVPHHGTPAMPLTAALLSAMLVLAVRRERTVALVALGSTALLLALILAAQAAGDLLPIGASLILLAGAIGGRVGLMIAARFRQQRMVDEDTGLPSRPALLEAARDGASMPLLVVLIANFDSLAAVLSAGAEHHLVLRLAERLRFIADDAIVYRVAPHLLAAELASDVDLVELTERLRPVLLAPIEAAGRRVDAVVAVGSDANDPAILGRLARATLAAEDAARAGRFWRADRLDLAAVEQHVSLLGELDRAVAAGEVTVAYQPKLALGTGRIASAEALVRWRTATGEMIPPSLFIPLAEQAGRITPLTLYILERVLADLAGWLAAGYDLTVAVNISAKLLGVPSFDAAVARAIAGSPVPPSRLIFEVTESATLDDASAALASLNRFHQLGIALSMDDYGTGQSTLSYLRDLPLAELKIDRTFVQHVSTNPKDEAMVRSTIELAHQFNLKVVAEGVEDRACLDRLAALGCDFAQGYYVSRPLPASALGEMLASKHERLAARGRERSLG
jgi:EAL domain-containing protein (putative c-di-GMP-specific phosphodiesterase class I)/CHASE2 domain-containing sensor protein